MRMGYDGLSGLVMAKMGNNPRSGDLYIFVNRPRNLIKMLRWEPGGFVMFGKRLEQGTFEIPPAKSPGFSQTIDYGQLAMMVTGFSLKHAKKRKRF
jgi:transposase